MLGGVVLYMKEENKKEVNGSEEEEKANEMRVTMVGS